MKVEELFRSKKEEDKLIKEFAKCDRKEDPLIDYWVKRKKQKEEQR
ncbi:MAG TPA: hypothetical protein VJ249_05155 [Candidatus Bathyarchaeia archaeon]|nr:hypothetical protein [Candidatus Bathyarchaeia archaeon]